MARVTHVYSIGQVARMTGESLELIEVVSLNSDNIDYGEMIHVHDGTEEGITTFTDRGIESWTPPRTPIFRRFKVDDARD